MLCKEGKVEFKVGNTFYRPQTQVVRDLGVLAALVYRQEYQQLRVLDVMSGSGVRSLRYCLESQADWVWSNEANPDHLAILQENLGGIVAAKKGRITVKNALDCLLKCHCDRDYYDLVDVDCFGSASPFLSASLFAVKNQRLAIFDHTYLYLFSLKTDQL